MLLNKVPERIGGLALWTTGPIPVVVSGLLIQKHLVKGQKHLVKGLSFGTIRK
jgi:hypothetical protein